MEARVVNPNIASSMILIKADRCEEDFLLRLGWVLMITTPHHKKKKYPWRLRLMNEDNGT